ncbi:MAG: tetratricopeptide repeat protein [Bryobacteraceae bacterium]|nr:tetratricopeptide repeat protein [Bryobacteraceae bacterium]
MTRSISVAALLLACCLSALGQARDNTPGFTSRFVAHGVVSIAGFGPAGRAHVSSNCASAPFETDSKGQFSIPGSVNMSGNAYCEFSIGLQGCEGRVISIMVPGGSVDLGRIVLKPLRGVSGAGTISFAALAAPPESAKLKDKASKNIKNRRFGDALKDLDKAIKLYDKDVEAVYLTGLVHKETRNDKDALARFQQAVALDPGYAPPRLQLAVYALRAQDWPALSRHASEVISLNPADYPDAWLYLATARLMQADYPGSESAARSAIQTSGPKDLPKAHHILGLALAKQGRTPEAITEIRIYLDRSPNAADTEAVERQLDSLQGSAAK